MHELSIAMNILEIAAEESERRGGARITAIHLKVGLLSGVVPEALHSAFELARTASSFEESQLVIDSVPITVRCPACNDESAVDSPQQLCCSQCGTPAADVIRGRELEICALEIEE